MAKAEISRPYYDKISLSFANSSCFTCMLSQVSLSDSVACAQAKFCENSLILYTTVPYEEVIFKK